MIPQHRLSAANRESTIALAQYAQYITDWIHKSSSNPDGRKLLGLYWGPENAESGRAGVVSGPGFRAYANDFPPGTRLIVTARVDLPCNRCKGTGIDPEDSSPGTIHGAVPEPPALEPCRACQPAPGEPAEEWQHGDVVLDARGHIWTRAHPDDQAQGWPWASGAEATVSHCGQPYSSEGGRSEDAPVRPLTLLVRNGRAAHTSDKNKGQQQ